MLWGHRPFPSSLPLSLREAFFPSHPSFTAGAPSTTGGKRSCCSTSSSLARAKFSAGVEASQARPEAPVGCRDPPFAPDPAPESHLQ